MWSIFNAKNKQDKITGAVKKLSDLEDKVIAYGSKSAIELCCYIQEKIYSGVKVDPLETMAAFGLLISQLKMDLTNKSMPPDVFYRITITDYPKQKEKITRFSNQIVAELNLDKSLIIS